MDKGKIANIGKAIVVAYLAVLSQYLLIGPVILVQGILSAAQYGPEAVMNPNAIMEQGMTPVMLVSFIMPIISLLLYVKFTEKRNIRSMGFVKEKALPDYLIGMVIAFVMFSVCVGLCVATGALSFDGYVLNGQYGMLALFFAGFLVQGMSEEVVCRGFMLTSVGSRSGALAGMLVNSLLFGALHIGNSGATVFSIANIVLFGILMSIVVLKTNSIWMAGAIHSVWNFVQGNFYGILVSGNDAGTVGLPLHRHTGHGTVERRQLRHGGRRGNDAYIGRVDCRGADDEAERERDCLNLLSEFSLTE